LASSVNENWSAKALWKVPELWKNQKTVFPQLLGPSVHTSHNAGCCGPSSNTTFLLLPEGDPYLRTLLVQGAQHILGPFGGDSDLRRWGLKLAERGGKNGKKRAVIAVARKLAVLLHRLWVSGEAYQPLRNSGAVELQAAA
jgi:hypothetical protein